MNSKDKVQNKLVASIRKTKQVINDSTVVKDEKEVPKKVKAVSKQATNNKKRKTQPVSKKTPEVKSGYFQTTNRVWPD